MRRWNGWGDSATSMSLNDAALGMLKDLAGPGLPPSQDASLEEFLAAIPPSRLPVHALISHEAAARFQVALGESYPDWIYRRTYISINKRGSQKLTHHIFGQRGIIFPLI